MMSVHFAADLSGIARGHDVLTRFLINPAIVLDAAPTRIVAV